MSRRHKHRNKNKVRPVAAHSHDEANKIGHEVFKNEDYTDEEIYESININCAHMLMSLDGADEDDLPMTYDEIVELLKKAPASNPHPAETDNIDEKP